jgi:hypothetical protein
MARTRTIVSMTFLMGLTLGCSGEEDEMHDDEDTGMLGLDGILRVNHIQMLGTHNSYHIQPSEPPGNAIPDWAYTRDPLDVQLAEQGVRAVELDTFWDVESGEVQVLHVPNIDAVSTCSPLAECLRVMHEWSLSNPLHHPLFVQIEPKDDEYSNPIEFDAYVDAVEAEILDSVPLASILTPDDVQGDAATLRDAITSRGWPTLGETRGKFVFFLNETRQFSEALTRGGTSVSGRLLFPETTPASPLAAVLIMNDPTSDIASVVEEGFIVRTRADGVGSVDSARREAALTSGAQIVTTDYPVVADGFEAMVIPGGRPSRCNPISAPPECTAEAIETLGAP